MSEANNRVRELDGVMGQQLQESEVAVREGEERLGEVEAGGSFGRDGEKVEGGRENEETG